MSLDFSQVTEVAGERVSREQILRMLSRYRFAERYCRDKAVLEVGCGSGQGLGILMRAAEQLVAADYTESLIRKARRHYANRVPLLRLDAHTLPFKPHTFDTIILYEAIYYLEKPDLFVKECMRVLNPRGTILICNANKNLPDFNPSPYSHRYFSPAEFSEFFKPHGLQVECYGDSRVDYNNPIQKMLSLIKQAMVRFNLMPKTMRGKLLFKRLVFGELVDLPAEIVDRGEDLPEPVRLNSDRSNQNYKVIFAVAVKAWP